MNKDEKKPNENVERKNLQSEERNKNISLEKVGEHPEPTNQTSDIPKAEIKNMEVHHHPDLHHKKKHFKEYFLEFLMIFLAVLLGFMADNLHERFTNREIEKNNIESLVNNLKGDSSQLTYLIQFNETRIKGIDSLLMLKNMNAGDSTIQKKQSYYGFVYVAYFQYFISNDAAIEQMKSSGSLRLIKKQNIADSILKYEYINKIIKLNESVLEFEYDKTLETAAKLNDLSAYAISTGTQFVPPHLASLSTSILGNLNGNDTVLTKEYFNYAAEQALSLKYYVVILLKQLDYAGSLIAFLQKQYNLQ